MDDADHPLLVLIGGVATFPYLVWSTWTGWAIATGGTVPLLGWHADPSPVGALLWLAVGEWPVFLIVVIAPLMVLYGLGLLLVRGLRALWRSAQLPGRG